MLQSQKVTSAKLNHGRLSYYNSGISVIIIDRVVVAFNMNEPLPYCSNQIHSYVND